LHCILEILAMSNRKPLEGALVARYPAMLALAVLVGTLTACTSQLDLAEPADTPPRTAAQPAPAIHDMPAPRDTRPMSAEERQRITDELAAARARQEAETTGTVPSRAPPAR
jgi:hypothetical protein